MARAKKLQVFVSSTYVDLREERQAAVEAILTAGHIPAGMELFTAGDQTQMEVIKQWIGESDVFLLILGGRYGSIEPTTQKSYIQLEYEYATEKKKALFAVVITEAYLDKKIRSHGKSVMETEVPQKLKEFRASVMTKMVRPWDDPRDIKIAVMETLSQFSRRAELVGWVPGDEASNTAVLVDEIARLTKENSNLRNQMQSAGSPAIYRGLTFDEMYKLLLSEELAFQDVPNISGDLRETAKALGHSKLALLHAVWWLGGRLSHTLVADKRGDRFKLCERLDKIGLIGFEQATHDTVRARFNDDGRNFLLRMKVKNEVEEAKKCVDQSNDR